MDVEISEAFNGKLLSIYGNLLGFTIKSMPESACLSLPLSPFW